MDEFIKLTEYNWAFWIAGLFALLDMGKWLYSTVVEFVFGKLGLKTKGMLKREETEKRLKAVEDSIEEIKNTSKHNVNMFLDHEQQVVGKFTGIRDEIILELNKMHDKMDEQAAENKETYCVILRSNINNEMRHISKHRDENGNAHISLADYETLDGLFKKYFSKDGNGAFKRIHEDEFENFVIDR